MDDRAERLRRRRKQSTARSNGEATADASTEDAEQSAPSKPSESSESSEPSESEAGPNRDRDAEDSPAEEADDDRAKPVKEQQIGTYMYLPETQVKHLRRQYNVLKAEYEFEYDEEFEKNRHFYPLVVQYGLDGLDELDVEEIRSQLKEFY